MSWSRGQSYSQDLRDRVLAADHASSGEVADRFGVSRSYVIKVRQRRDRLGDVAPGAQRSHTLPKLAGHDDTLRARVAEQSDQTLEELREWLLHTLGISVSVSNLCGRFAQARADTQKKSLAAAEQDRADIAEARRAWKRAEAEARSQAAGFPGRDLDQDQHDQVAWPGATGQRLIAKAPYGHWKTSTFLAGLRHDRVVAPLVLDGAINGCAFLAYVEQVSRPDPAPRRHRHCR